MDYQELIQTFIEQQRENAQEFLSNLTVYYHGVRSYLSEKSHQRHLFLSVFGSLIVLTIISVLIFQSRRLSKFIRILSSYLQLIYLRIRNKLLQKTTPSLLNLFLNSKNAFREKFAKEFLRALNNDLLKRKVKSLIINDDLFSSHLYAHTHHTDVFVLKQSQLGRHMFLLLLFLGTTQRGNTAICQRKNSECFTK